MTMVYWRTETVLELGIRVRIPISQQIVLLLIFLLSILFFVLVGPRLRAHFFLYPDQRSLDFGISRVVASSPGRHVPAGRSPY